MLAIRRRRVALSVLAVATVLIVALGAWHLSGLRLRGELVRQVQDRLTISQRSVESEIERFRYLPGVIGQDERITRLLARSDSAEAIAAANAYLQTVRGMAGADELYVLDTQGMTLSASNWNEPGSFVGHSYAFRPYFQDAMQTGSGRFYAVGVTTGKPGYFLSSRIEMAGRTVGVAVVKVDMAPLANIWAQAGEMSGLADQDGVVFLSGEPGWVYRPLSPLAPTTLSRLADERRYDGIDLAGTAPLDLTFGDNTSDTLRYEGQTLLFDTRSIEPDGWQLLSALPIEPVEREARLTGAMAGLVTLVLFAVLALLWQRRQITRLKLEQNAVLERRVAERTAELRATQESLIHAAKLAALGRMSAAIVHEVSQPLTALDNTLAAADLHAKRGSGEEVSRTVGSARTLLKRMQRTVKHLRTFSSRREPEPPQKVGLPAVLEAALEIVQPQAREAAITLSLEAGDALPPVSGNAVRLEQVFINLLLNAVEATALAGNSRIDITTASRDGLAVVEIADTGAGMPEAVRERLFEPFFTTKATGESLGLGLSITKTLLEEFGGTLTFTPRPEGGTLARVTLPLHLAPATPRTLIPA
ncbi:MAG: sensor histidine kinase [Devosia sp.]|uniref:sensor histidine kinase n=1 Tax=Devosia sp. TaxID=1871048 RepID=UPI0024C531EC|nr:ATP-binding protein [Devosia sp.]UYO01261.1 MAG: sensor histidine kinase [Devosia sp.]